MAYGGKRRNWILLAMLLGCCTVQAQEKTALCGENETFCISKLDGGEQASLIYEYDSCGNYLGRSWKYLGEFPPQNGFLSCSDTYEDAEEACEREKDLLEAEGYERDDMRRTNYRNYPGHSYCRDCTAAYILTDTGCTIAWGEEMIQVRFPEEGLYPSVFNEEVTVAVRNSGETPGEACFWIIENETGNILAKAEGESFRGFRLGDGYCTFTEELYKEESFPERKKHVIDYYGETLFETESTVCEAWENGLIYLERGPYRGLADLNGDWVFKAIKGEY